MPIYEYECFECKNIEEVFQEKFYPFTHEVLCSKCGKQMKKLISRSSFHLKGDGWAKDNYSNKKG